MSRDASLSNPGSRGNRSQSSRAEINDLENLNEQERQRQEADRAREASATQVAGSTTIVNNYITQYKLRFRSITPDVVNYSETLQNTDDVVVAYRFRQGSVIINATPQSSDLLTDIRLFLPPAKDHGQRPLTIKLGRDGKDGQGKSVYVKAADRGADTDVVEHGYYNDNEIEIQIAGSAITLFPYAADGSNKGEWHLISDFTNQIQQ